MSDQTNAQPFTIPKYRPGLDYQVAHEGKLINGRKYRAGEILVQAGLTQAQIEMWREQRLIIDIPMGGNPIMPIPDADDGNAPLSTADKEAMKGAADPNKPQGKVAAKHIGFGKWQCVDSDNKKIAPVFEGEDKAGRPAKTRCLMAAIEINEANDHEVTAEERAEAGMTFKDKDDD